LIRKSLVRAQPGEPILFGSCLSSLVAPQVPVPIFVPVPQPEELTRVLDRYRANPGRSSRRPILSGSNASGLQSPHQGVRSLQGDFLPACAVPTADAFSDFSLRDSRFDFLQDCRCSLLGGGIVGIYDDVPAPRAIRRCRLRLGFLGRLTDGSLP